MDFVLSSKKSFMKALMQLRKKLAHRAIGPLVGALLAGILLIVLMLNINNGEGSIDHTIGTRHAYVRILGNDAVVSTDVLPYSVKPNCLSLVICFRQLSATLT